MAVDPDQEQLAELVAALPHRTEALERAALICCPQPVEGAPAP